MEQGLVVDAPILVDTDVLVDLFRGYKQAADYITTYFPQIILSSIVVAELYAGVRGSAEQTALGHFFALSRVIPVSSEIARIGGLYKSVYGKSHGIGLADAIIAATAETEKAELITLNTKHYPMIKGLSPPYTK